MPATWKHERVVGVVGSAGSGRSSLITALAQAGAHASAPDASGSHDPLAVIDWRGTHVALLDDLQVEQALLVPDALLVVVSSPDGVDTALGALWQRCEELRIPRIVVITKLDHEHADMDETVAVLRRVLSDGPELLRLTMPVLDDDATLGGFIDLATTEIWNWTGPDVTRHACDPEHLALIGETRDELIADLAMLSEDPRLAASLQVGMHPGIAQITEALAATSRTAHAQLIVGSGRGARGPVGAELILDLLVSALPSPAERHVPVVMRPDGAAMLPVQTGPDSALVATVAADDPGHGALVRVFAGALGDAVSVDGVLPAVGITVTMATAQLAWAWSTSPLAVGSSLSAPDNPLVIAVPDAEPA